METQKTAIRLLRLLPLLFHSHSSGATGSRQSKNPALWVCLLPNLLTMAGPLHSAANAVSPIRDS